MEKLYVVKIGTNAVLDKEDNFKEWTANEIARDVKSLYDNGNYVVMVVSGAIGLGRKVLGITREEFRSLEKENFEEYKQQAKNCASVGQLELMEHYNNAFSGFARCGQILLEYDELTPKKSGCAVNTIKYALKWRPNKNIIIPTINYNDPTNLEELLKDNDELAAKVAVHIGADEVIILSDTDGFYSAEGQHLPIVSEISDEILAACKGKGYDGTGGMETKIIAIKNILWPAGISARIGNVNKENPIIGMINGFNLHTYFPVTIR